MSRILACGETLVGLATAAASLPGTSTQIHLADWLLAGFLGLLPTAYSLAAGVLSRVNNESAMFAFEEESAPLAR